jgi:hypothetical protein
VISSSPDRRLLANIARKTTPIDALGTVNALVATIGVNRSGREPLSMAAPVPPHQAAGDIGAHPAQTDDTDLHAESLG